jgi:hypothetical protein
MFQWILMFESREEITARGIDPNDRVPEYARQVDEARLQGKPVALVVRTGLREFKVIPQPQSALIEANFPLAPALRSPSNDATGRQIQH